MNTSKSFYKISNLLLQTHMKMDKTFILKSSRLEFSNVLVLNWKKDKILDIHGVFKIGNQPLNRNHRFNKLNLFSTPLVCSPVIGHTRKLKTTTKTTNTFHTVCYERYYLWTTKECRHPRDSWRYPAYPSVLILAFWGTYALMYGIRVIILRLSTGKMYNRRWILHHMAKISTQVMKRNGMRSHGI